MELCDRLFRKAQDEVEKFNYGIAIKLFEKAYDEGKLESLHELGNLYAIKVQDGTKAIKVYRQAIMKQYRADDAYYKIGEIFFNGIGGIEQNHQEAIRSFERGKSSGCVYMVGKMLLKGLGTQENKGEAVKMFRKASQMGSFRAMRIMSKLYKAGVGLPQNLKKAKKWAEKAKRRKDELDIEKKRKEVERERARRKLKEMSYAIDSVVWIKMADYDPWPAKIVDMNEYDPKDSIWKEKHDNDTLAEFFGDSTMCWLNSLNPIDDRISDVERFRLSDPKVKDCQDVIEDPSLRQAVEKAIEFLQSKLKYEKRKKQRKMILDDDDDDDDESSGNKMKDEDEEETMTRPSRPEDLTDFRDNEGSEENDYDWEEVGRRDGKRKIIRVGWIVDDEAFHDEDHIFPVGYKVLTIHEKRMISCSVERHVDREDPIFKLTRYDDSDGKKSLTHHRSTSIRKAWQNVTTVVSPDNLRDFFGFTHVVLAHLPKARDFCRRNKSVIETFGLPPPKPKMNIVQRSPLPPNVPPHSRRPIVDQRSHHSPVSQQQQRYPSRPHPHPRGSGSGRPPSNISPLPPPPSSSSGVGGSSSGYRRSPPRDRDRDRDRDRHSRDRRTRDYEPRERSRMRERERERERYPPPPHSHTHGHGPPPRHSHSNGRYERSGKPRTSEPRGSFGHPSSSRPPSSSSSGRPGPAGPAGPHVRKQGMNPPPSSSSRSSHRQNQPSHHHSRQGGPTSSSSRRQVEPVRNPPVSSSSSRVSGERNEGRRRSPSSSSTSKSTSSVSRPIGSGRSSSQRNIPRVESGGPPRKNRESVLPPKRIGTGPPPVSRDRPSGPPRPSHGIRPSQSSSSMRKAPSREAPSRVGNLPPPSTTTSSSSSRRIVSRGALPPPSRLPHHSNGQGQSVPPPSRSSRSRGSGSSGTLPPVHHGSDSERKSSSSSSSSSSSTLKGSLPPARIRRVIRKRLSSNERSKSSTTKSTSIKSSNTSVRVARPPPPKLTSSSSTTSGAPKKRPFINRDRVKRTFQVAFDKKSEDDRPPKRRNI